MGAISKPITEHIFAPFRAICGQGLTTAQRLIGLSVLIAELLYISLAISDMVSDVLLLKAIQDMQSSYETQQHAIQDKKNTKSYHFEYCIPATLTTSWESEVDNRCVCNNADILCDDLSSSQITYIGPNSTDIIINSQFSDMAELRVTCKQHYIRPYENSFIFNRWSCFDCECDGHLYDTNSSMAILKLKIDYESLDSDKTKYCNPNTMLKYNQNDLVDSIVTACYAFVVIGILSQILAICCRCFAVGYTVLTDSDQEQDAFEFRLDMWRMATGFFVSLMEDVPQTIVAMYYLVFLYTDNGYFCHKSFSEYPELQELRINPQDTIWVILVENARTCFAVVSSILMIIVTGLRNGFKMFSRKSDKKVYSIVISFLYIMLLLTPIFAVAYFDIAPSLYKTWSPSLIVFIIGCISWGTVFVFCVAYLIIRKYGNQRSRIPNTMDSEL